MVNGTISGSDKLRAVSVFLLDKGSDLLIAFAGLLLALQFQGELDDSKERSAYLQSLEGFERELSRNYAALEQKDVVFERAIADQNLIVKHYFYVYELLERWNRPEETAAIFELIDESVAELTDETLVDGKAVFDRLNEQRPLDLVPRFEDEIWQVYVAGGVNIAQRQAEDGTLARDLGSVYSQLDVIKRHSRDIESHYNDKLLPGLLMQANRNSVLTFDVRNDPATGKQFEDIEAQRRHLDRIQPRVSARAKKISDQVSKVNLDLKNLEGRVSSRSAQISEAMRMIKATRRKIGFEINNVRP